jgi:2-methylcitrate dehydratase PrpD
VAGATRVLEGPKGLYAQYHGGRYARAELVDGLGERFAGVDVAPKPYPSCRGGHNAIDAALQLQVKPHDIERITIRMGAGEFGLLGAPIDVKRRPASVVAAQFSNPWMVAAALHDGEVTLRHFTPEALQRADLLALTARIDTAEDKSLGRPGGGPGAVLLEVRSRDGATQSCRVAQAKGDPRNPMTAEEMSRKFLDCARVAGLAADHAAALLRRLQQLENEADVAALVAAMVTDIAAPA